MQPSNRRTAWSAAASARQSYGHADIFESFAESHPAGLEHDHIGAGLAAPGSHAAAGARPTIPTS
jgi:hypothetical protein